MKTEIEKILHRHHANQLSTDNAINEVLGLFDISGSLHNPNFGIDNPIAKGEINTGGVGYKALEIKKPVVGCHAEGHIFTGNPNVAIGGYKLDKQNNQGLKEHSTVGYDAGGGMNKGCAFTLSDVMNKKVRYKNGKVHTIIGGDEKIGLLHGSADSGTAGGFGRLEDIEEIISK